MPEGIATQLNSNKHAKHTEHIPMNAEGMFYRH